MRLFVALDLSEEVRNALRRGMDALRDQGSGNFTRPENLHLTLAFLGETPRVKVAAAAVQAVEAPAFSIAFSGIGRFGDLYWAGVAPSPALTVLQRQVSALLEARGFSLDRRPFRPHLTLCRGFRPAGAFDPAAVETALGHPACRIDRVRLMDSSRVNGRLVYTEVSRKLLIPGEATGG